MSFLSNSRSFSECDVEASAVVCVLCRGFLRNTRVLECGHLCCEVCAKRQFEYAVAGEMAKGVRRADAVPLVAETVVCGECGAKSALGKLKSDGGKSREMIEKVEEKLKRCKAKQCEEIGSVLCKECGWFCEKHAEQHDAFFEHEKVKAHAELSAAVSTKGNKWRSRS